MGVAGPDTSSSEGEYAAHCANIHKLQSTRVEVFIAVSSVVGTRQDRTLTLKPKQLKQFETVETVEVET